MDMNAIVFIIDISVLFFFIGMVCFFSLFFKKLKKMVRKSRKMTRRAKAYDKSIKNKL